MGAKSASGKAMDEEKKGWTLIKKHRAELLGQAREAAKAERKLHGSKQDSAVIIAQLAGYEITILYLRDGASETLDLVFARALPK